MSNYKSNLIAALRSGQVHARIQYLLHAGCAPPGSTRPGARPQAFGSVKRGALSNTLWLATMTAEELGYFFAASTTFRAAALLLTFALAWLKLPGAAGQ
jgi:hypothetical protein